MVDVLAVVVVWVGFGGGRRLQQGVDGGRQGCIAMALAKQYEGTAGTRTHTRTRMTIIDRGTNH